MEASTSTLSQAVEVFPDPIRGVVVLGRAEASTMGHPLGAAEAFPGPIKEGAVVVVLAAEAAFD